MQKTARRRQRGDVKASDCDVKRLQRADLIFIFYTGSVFVCIYMICPML